MNAVFKTIETIGGGIYFDMSIIFTGNTLQKHTKKMTHFVIFTNFSDIPPNSFNGFEFTMSYPTFKHQKFAFQCITQLAPSAQIGNFGHINR